jgi:hypothetical protein
VKARIGDHLRFLGVKFLVIAPSVDPVSKLSAGLSGGLGDVSEYSVIVLGEVSGAQFEYFH